MKRLFSAVLLLCALCYAASARTPELRFNDGGKFKVLQLTDLHLVGGYDAEASKTLKQVKEFVRDEKPDLIAVTGDVISQGVKSGYLLDRFLKTIDSLGIPFFIVFGNHDQEQELTKAQMASRITACRNSINVIGENGELADMRVPVKTHNGGEDALELYLLDSHTSIDDESPLADMHIRYEWFTFDQVWWIRNEFRKSAEEHGKVLPSAAFFHIPLPEFLEAWERTTSEYFTHNNVDGVRGEYGGHSRMNSGMFAAMFEAGSIMAVLCGHDHDSDFIVNHYGISLIYGRCSGNDPTYHHLLPGARVIEFREGRREFSTWIREENGKISYVNDYSDGVLK